MKKLTLQLIAASSLILLTAGTSFGASPASDSAGNYTGWDSGNAPNNGTGFGSWSFSTSGSGGQYLGDTALSGTSFGVYAGGANTLDLSSVTRQFTGALTSGQSFSIDLGYTGIDFNTPGEIGVSLLDGASVVFTMKFIGGDTNWLLNDGGGDFGTNVPFSYATDLKMAFTYNGGSGYNIVLTQGTDVYTGNNYTAHDTISHITGVKVYSNSQGSGENVGFDNLQIVPEPSSVALLLGSSLFGGGMYRIRRKRSQT